MEILCTCPVCGGDINEKEKFYGCSNWQDKDGGCQAKIWKNVSGFAVTPEYAKCLFEGGTMEEVPITKRNGEETTCTLAFVDGELSTTYPDGSKGGGMANVVCKCPTCDGDILEREKFYGCSNWADDKGACQTKMWKSWSGTTFTTEQAKALFEGGTVDGIVAYNHKGEKTDVCFSLVDGELKIDDADGTFFEPVCKCISCGGDIVGKEKFYGCSNWQESNGACGVRVWKNMGGHDITPDEVKKLMEGEKLTDITMTAKSGSPYTCNLVYEEGEVKRVFPESKEFETICKCPTCEDGEIKDRPRSYGCSNYKGKDQGCQTTIFKNMSGRDFTKEEAITLFEGGLLENVEMTNKDGKPYTCDLKFVDGKLEREFKKD